MPFEIASENAIIYYLDEPISERSIHRLKQIGETVANELGTQLISCIPSYRSLLITFNALTVNHQQAIQRLNTVINELTQTRAPTANHSQLVRLPVFYDPETGPDLPRIAKHHDIDIEDVITRHCMTIYHVYAIGFAPGFAYLGHVDEKIAMPRLTTPRQKVAQGSVGIADRQTAIYPAASPGGWNIIGRCPSLLFNPDAEPAMPFKVGDRVQFMPITEQEYRYLGGEL